VHDDKTNLWSRRREFAGPDKADGEDKGLASNINEVDASGQTGVESTDLRVNVCKKRQAGLTADLHDERVINALKFQGHCSGGTERVGTDPFEVVSLCDQVCLQGGSIDESIDILGNDMNTGANPTERCSWDATLRHKAGDPSSECLDGTKPSRTRGVMDGGAALSVLLVV
jgi:hypothetical protein